MLSRLRIWGWWCGVRMWYQSVCNLDICINIGTNNTNMWQSICGNQYVAINMWQSICGNQYVANLMFCEVMKTRYALITRSMCVPLISVQWSICGNQYVASHQYVINIWSICGINMWQGRGGGPSTRETSPPALISVQWSICGINIWQVINMWSISDQYVALICGKGGGGGLLRVKLRHLH